MIKILLGVGLLGLLTSSAFSGLVIAGLWRFLARRRAARPAFLPPVSLFKPLYGAEPNLEAHLETFFQQDYPEFEIIFGARVSADAGLQAARRVAARYPKVPVRFVLTGEPWHVNAKVSTLELMERTAAHDIFVVSDSDVQVNRDYIREVVAPFAEKSVGAVTCLYRGVADQGLWSKLEAAGMSIEMTAGVLVADLMEGMQFTLGPTMAVRRSCAREIGGFGALGAYCADDFVLGNAIASNGHTVVLSTHAIDHVVLNTSFVVAETPDPLDEVDTLLASQGTSRHLSHIQRAVWAAGRRRCDGLASPDAGCASAVVELGLACRPRSPGRRPCGG